MNVHTEPNPTLSEIIKIDNDIIALVSRRNVLLCRFRLSCKHLRVVEFDGAPPRRICVECGAEEEGWCCGYQVLGSNSRKRIVEQTRNIAMFFSYRKGWPPYFVGQSHKNFLGSGHKTHKELTEVSE
jgi:hypothetical protein